MENWRPVNFPGERLKPDHIYKQKDVENQLCYSCPNLESGSLASGGVRLSLQNSSNSRFLSINNSSCHPFLSRSLAEHCEQQTHSNLAAYSSLPQLPLFTHHRALPAFAYWRISVSSLALFFHSDFSGISKTFIFLIALSAVLPLNLVLYKAC